MRKSKKERKKCLYFFPKAKRGKLFQLFTNLKQIQKKIFMKNFTTYLSTAPVVALVWFTITAALLIEINRFFPDPLVFSF
jgi:photosystem I subunit 9